MADTEKEKIKAEKKKLRQEKKRRRQFKNVFKFLHGLYHALLSIFCSFRRFGHKQYYDDKAYIFVCNHLSWYDVFPCALATRKPVHFICKSELENSAGGRLVIRMCQCIPVNRDGSDVRAVMQAVRYLKNGESIAVFPEGTRNKSKEIFLPFKSGAAMISIKTKTPIVPVVIAKKMKVFRRNYVYYGEPMEFTEFYGKKLTAQDIEYCDNLLREKMLSMYNEINLKIAETKKKKSRK